MDGGGERRGMELSGGLYETCEGGGERVGDKSGPGIGYHKCHDMQQESILKISKVAVDWSHSVQHSGGAHPGCYRLSLFRAVRWLIVSLLLVMAKIVPCMELALKVNATVCTVPTLFPANPCPTLAGSSSLLSRQWNQE